MKLYYKELGSGFPLIMLHGVFGASDNLSTVSKFLAESNKVFLVDQRNHGKSPHSNEFSYSEMSEDLNELLLDLNLKQINLLGHSMGGKVSMEFAINYPDKVKNLIIVDIAPKYYPPHHQTILEGLKAIDLNTIESRQDADNMLSQYVKEPEIRQFLLKNLSRENDGFKWKINLEIIDQKIGNIGEELDQTRTFKNPTLFIRGGRSKYILDEDIDSIKKVFPNSTVETIPTASHWVHAEAPQEFVGLVNNFLDANS